LEPIALPHGIVFERHVVGESDAPVAGLDRLIYSNTSGAFAVATGANFLADDIATVAVPGCKLRRIEFPVVGKVNPAGTGGPYTVSFGVYATCPGSVPADQRQSWLVPGTAGQLTFPNDSPRRIVFTLPGGGTAIGNNIWFGVTFSRANAGLVVGAPPLTGMSCDRFDFPGFPCRAALGGFPERPHASFNLELFGDAACEASFVAYKNDVPSGPVLNPGTDTWLVDDITPAVPKCRMTGYEVGVRGVGFYEFEMRRHCEGNTIAGTQKFGTLTQGDDARVFRFEVNPPVALPDFFHFATRVQNDSAGIVTTGWQACVGETSECYGIPGEFPNTECGDVCPAHGILPAGLHGGVNLTITCAGPPPAGACCDMYFPQCVGGPDDGALCCPEDLDAGAFCYQDAARIDAYPPCASPGTCESTCRELPQMNCPFPPRFSQMRPEWRPGALCEPDPFVPVSCGKAACCEPDFACHNLTVNECYSVPPLDEPRQWLMGRICGQGGQYCNPCGRAKGECTQSRQCDDPECIGALECVGCEIIACCDAVCQLGAVGRYCCETCWDDTCVDLANQFCGQPIFNDECKPSGRSGGAIEIWINRQTHIGTGFTDHSRATPRAAGDAPNDPGIGCYIDNPGAQGLQTVWYKWTAPFTERTRIQACNSSSPADDSLVVVYAVGDPTDDLTSCNSLIPIACNDDFNGCSASGTNSRVCIYAEAGKEYYAMVASKFRETNPGTGYRIEVRSNPPAGTCEIWPNNNYCLSTTCPDITPPGGCITDGTTAFDFTPTAPYVYDLDGPADPCIPTTTVDMWFDYNATCTGALTVHTCGASVETSPDTNLAIYEGCDACPSTRGIPAPIACNADAGGEPCGDSAKVVLDVVEGECYTIRLGDSSLSMPTGNLTLSCEQADCPGGTMNFLDPPEGVVDAQRPNQPGNPNQLLGIQTITAQGTPSAQRECFTLCETAQAGTPANNDITGFLEDPPGMYTLTLARPITPGAKTTITYTDTHGNLSKLHMASCPGNVRGDGTSSPQDIQDLSAALSGACLPPCATPWDSHSIDLDRSGMFTPADILDAADYLAGVGYMVWNGHPNPISSQLCP
jgi:hypothetical protein